LGTRRLIRTTDDERVLNIAKKMESSTTNVVDILEQVKSQEKLLMDKKSLSLSKINLSEVVNDIVLIYEDVFIQKNLFVKIDIPSELKLIRAEKVSLKNNVLGNIISNSIKFSRHNSQISISARNIDHGVVLEIRDSGSGFSPEALKCINEDYKVNFSTIGTHGEIGTGFGLRIIKSYVNLFKGEIDAYNDGGAVFKIVFKS
jgi:signal transduction histidine kinase